MLALAAARLGLKTSLTTKPTRRRFRYVRCDRAAMTIANARYLCVACDAVTFEFENVPAATADLARANPVFPGAARSP